VTVPQTLVRHHACTTENNAKTACRFILGVGGGVLDNDVQAPMTNSLPGRSTKDSPADARNGINCSKRLYHCRQR